jgi:bifunctional DNase/RNase
MGKSYAIDSRPSDALALALRTGAPIFITGNVIDSLMDLSMDEDEMERFRRLMQQLEDEESGAEGH